MNVYICVLICICIARRPSKTQSKITYSSKFVNV